MPIILESQVPVIPPPGKQDARTAGGLLEELGMRMGDFASGVVSSTSPSVDYLDDITRNEPSDTFRGGWLTYVPLTTSIAAAANYGIERRITGFDGFDGTNVGRFLIGNGALGAGLPVPAQAGDNYVVHMRWSRRRKLAALNRGIRRLPQGFWRRIEDTSITTADRVWTYALPTGMTTLWEVWIQISTNLSGPGMLAQGQDGRGFPFQRVEGWTVREDVDQFGVVTRVLQLGDLPPWPRTLRLVGAGIQGLLTLDSDLASVGQDDYDQRLQEYLLSYAAGYLWMEGADGAPIDQAARSVEMVKLSMQIAAELRNDLVMPPPASETDTPATTGRRGWGDNPYWMAALSTPNYAAR